jgi:uncharacterized membrane protein YeaQ/YmgE (transglycosylase-associated protein family)
MMLAIWMIVLGLVVASIFLRKLHVMTKTAGSVPRPTPAKLNFGQRMAKSSLLAAISNALLVALCIPMFVVQATVNAPISFIPLLCSLGLLVIGLVSGVVALATMGRYGRNGILFRATTGLCGNLAASAAFHYFLGNAAMFSNLTGKV